MMNKPQTFTTKLENEQNKMIDFERWSYKRVITVEKSVKQLYKNCDFALRDAIKRGATKLSIYSTDPNGDNEVLVKSISVAELLK